MRLKIKMVISLLTILTMDLMESYIIDEIITNKDGKSCFSHGNAMPCKSCYNLEKPWYGCIMNELGQIVYRQPKQKTQSYHFITINLPFDSLLLEERKRENYVANLIKCFKIDKFSYVNENTYLWNMEFFSEKSTNTMNPHIHMLIYSYGKLPYKSRIVRDFSRLMKVNANFVDVVSGKNPNRYIVYLTGDKTQEKTQYQVKDREYRSFVKIKDFYSNRLV